MNPMTINITTLSEDIRQIANPIGREKMDMFRFCKDHSSPIIMQDKKPILDITQDEFLRIFGKKSDHLFLTPEQICRIGRFAKRSLPAIIALMLKAAWEIYLAEITSGLKGSGSDLCILLKDTLSITKHISGFNPNRDKIYSQLKDRTEFSEGNITYSKCDFYIRDLLAENTFLGDNETISLEYPERDITEEILLENIHESQKTAYFRQKGQWKQKSGELDEMLLYLERRKRTNQNIEDRYFRTFSKNELEKSKLHYRIEKFRIILELMPAHPNVSYRELARRAENSMLSADKKRNNLKMKIIRSLTYLGDPGVDNSSEPVTAEFKNAYMDACKKMLKKLFFLLHTDTCPRYSEISQQKQSQINELWLELMKDSKEESFSFSQSMMLYSLPDLEQLESIYRRACEILEIKPENFEIGNRLEFMISTGTPIEQIMEFLYNETENLELHLAHLELIQNEYTNEDNTQEYREALDDISAHTEKLRTDVKKLKEQVIDLKRKISKDLLKFAKS